MSPKFKLTKQGVRDLNSIKAPPGGIRLEEPPKPFLCKHKNKREDASGYFITCEDCGVSWDAW